MKSEEIITINKRLTWMRDNIHKKLTQEEPICDVDSVNVASDMVFEIVLDWLANNVEDIEFKSMPKVETMARPDKQG